MKEIEREIQDLLMGIIYKREKASKGRNDDLLGILMESNSREIKEFGNKKSAGMSIKDVIEECKYSLKILIFLYFPIKLICIVFRS